MLERIPISEEAQKHFQARAKQEALVDVDEAEYIASKNAERTVMEMQEQGILEPPVARVYRFERSKADKRPDLRGVHPKEFTKL